jgi:hypothetical protein
MRDSVAFEVAATPLCYIPAYTLQLRWGNTDLCSANSDGHRGYKKATTTPDQPQEGARPGEKQSMRGALLHKTAKPVT